MNNALAPLAGVRVLDFTMMMAGPLCTRMLADLGAEVIKIEAPEGDFIRVMPPLREGNSTYFGHLNSGKKSVVLDLKRKECLEIAVQMAEKSDVLVQSFRPGVMKRFGLDYESLSERNPSLVYCSVSGFGQTGPSAERPAYAQIIQAASGFDLANMRYQDNAEKPANVAMFMADVMTGVFGLNAIQSALLQRAKTGNGQHLDVTLMESMMNMFVYEFQEAQFHVERPRVVYKPLRALDGFVMTVSVTPANFYAMCDAVGHPEWKTHPHFLTPALRNQHADELRTMVEEWTSVRTALECETLLNEAGVPCSRYRELKDVITDPAMCDRGAFARVRDDAGEFLVPNLPYRLMHDGASVRGRVPALGEHTYEVLASVVGLSKSAVDALTPQKPFHR